MAWIRINYEWLLIKLNCLFTNWLVRELNYEFTKRMRELMTRHGTKPCTYLTNGWIS